MKEASGELNMTLITILAIVAIGTLFTVFVLPRIRGSIDNKWDQVETLDPNAGGALNQ